MVLRWGLLQKLVVLRSSGTISEIGGAEMQWDCHRLVVLRCSGTVTEIGGAEVLWDCHRSWWC